MSSHIHDLLWTYTHTRITRLSTCRKRENNTIASKSVIVNKRNGRLFVNQHTLINSKIQDYASFDNVDRLFRGNVALSRQPSHGIRTCRT